MEVIDKPPPPRAISGERVPSHRTIRIAGLVGPTASLGFLAEMNILSLLGFEPQIVWTTAYVTILSTLNGYNSYSQ
jgi:hypothetical protein